MESEPTQPVGFRQSPMPMESSDGIAQLVNPTKTRGYRWGKFQGWVILVFGALDLLDGHPILLGNMYGRLGGILLVITGIGLINRAKEGLVLFFICNGALLAGFLWTFRFSILSFDFESMAGAPLALLALLLAWWLTPAIFYYPKRWKELSRSPSKAAPGEAPQRHEFEPQEARTEKQSNSAREDRSPNILKKFRDGFSREHHFRVGEAPMYFNEGMRRLAVFAGVLGAVAGGFYAHKNLRNVPSERYQHRVFEKLAASDVVKRDQSILRLAKENGAILNEPISSELLHPRSAINLPKGLTLITPPATLPPDFKDWDSTKPASTNGIKAIFYKPDLTIDYFEMQDGGYVSSEPSPSAWSYLLWVVFPALGFFILWSAIRGIAWVGTGFFQPPN